MNRRKAQTLLRDGITRPRYPSIHRFVVLLTPPVDGRVNIGEPLLRETGATLPESARDASGKFRLEEWVLAVNKDRRHLTPSEKAAIALNVTPMLEAEARERQLATLKKGEQPPDVAILPPRDDQGKSRDKAAKMLGVSARYISDAKKIKEEAPETFERIATGEISIPEAKREYRDFLPKGFVVTFGDACSSQVFANKQRA